MLEGQAGEVICTVSQDDGGLFGFLLGSASTALSLIKGSRSRETLSGRNIE